MIELERQRVVLEEEEAVGVAEEVLLAGCRRRLERRIRRGHLPKIGDRAADPLHVEERVLPDDREVFLEQVLGVGIEGVAQRVGIVVEPRMAAAVAIPRGAANPPAVFHRHEMAGLLLLARQHARSAGESRRREDGIAVEGIGDGPLPCKVIRIFRRLLQNWRPADGRRQGLCVKRSGAIEPAKQQRILFESDQVEEVPAGCDVGL